jgi:hypothetical protein
VRTWLPSVLFFFVLALCNFAFEVSVGGSLFVVPIIVAACADVAASARTRGVVVWEDRRVTAAHAIRAMLDANHVEAAAEGMAVLSLFQAFAPFAPARIVVSEGERESADAFLKRLEDTAKESREEASPLESGEASAPAIGLPLAVCALLAAVATALAPPLRHDDATAVVTKRASFEIVRADDADVFHGVTAPPGVDLYDERVGERATSYASVAVGGGVTEAAARARLDRFLASVQPPGDGRFAIGHVTDDIGAVVALRSYVLTGGAVVQSADIEHASAMSNDDANVLVTLRPEGAERFAEVSGEWTGRRLAIVIGGDVESAPTVRSRIDGGHVSIYIGPSTDPANVRRARELAAMLQP